MQPTIKERIQFYLKQTNSPTEIAKQISLDTGKPIVKQYITEYIKRYNLKRPLANKKLKVHEK